VLLSGKKCAESSVHITTQNYSQNNYDFNRNIRFALRKLQIRLTAASYALVMTAQSRPQNFFLRWSRKLRKQRGAEGDAGAANVLDKGTEADRLPE